LLVLLLLLLLLRWRLLLQLRLRLLLLLGWLLQLLSLYHYLPYIDDNDPPAGLVHKVVLAQVAMHELAPAWGAGRLQQAVRCCTWTVTV